jgi:RNA polymerase sigma-70 factor (ECF subfamily)
MTAVQAGSIAAFEDLVQQNSGRLFRTILRITKNREDAEDALQDAFLRAFVALQRFEGRSSVYSWLTRIAMNSALMVLRKRRTHPEVLLLSSFEEGDYHPSFEIKDSAYNPEQLCDLHQRRQRILHAIRKLEPHLRTPLEIQLDGELPVRDIANALNISVPAAKSRLYRARTRLARRVY